ncbi:MAG: hypothetical protein KIG77_01250 [Treponema sp.]|uniref:hypothetical protein n=1 Tax=Treponema sp. TaxID=166 RepID=UPI001DC81647|nr:hypothetical protein [Treponema sp.]MBS7240990.1 hypothetical protein [Treponema sp.]
MQAIKILVRILNWNQIYEKIASTVKNVLSKKELQVEDPEFDRWCDKVVAVLEKAKKRFFNGRNLV